MYRKYSSFAKCSRNERLAQLTEQESVIEKKKREIQAKLEAQKKKETEEALKKFESSNTDKNNSPNPSKRHISNRQEKFTEDVEANSSCPRNAFTNDGSFLDQFKKLSKSSLGPKSVDISTSAKSRKKDENGSRVENSDEKDGNSKWIVDDQERSDYKNLSKNRSPSRKLQDSNIQLQLPPPGIIQLVPEPKLPVKELQVNTPCLSHIQGVPNSNLPEPIPSFTQSKIFTNNVQTRENSSPSITHSSPTLPLHALNYQNTSSESKVTNPGSTLAPSLITPGFSTKPSLLEDISPQMPIQMQTISPPAKSQIFDGTMIKQKGTLSVPQDHANKSSLMENMRDEVMDGNKVSPVIAPTNQIPGIIEKLSNSTTVDSTRISPALTCNEAGQNSISERSQLTERHGETAQYKNPIKNSGDVSHESPQRDSESDSEGKRNREKRKTRNSNSGSSDSDTNSKDSYHSNRREDFRSEKHSNRDGYQADYEDELSSKRSTAERQKKYLFHKASEEFSSSGKGKADDSEKSETGTSSERRKRKRKSRWGDEVVPNSISTGGATSSGIQLPPQVQIAALAPGKMPLLSKLTRSDPGLIQYARQTFGSTNLSEEDWKKAEDHYKINLLYQDMVKKRAEIESLEKAGKFKYEYDSDEDVEGGTWEHKLRQQEMLATQLWAEELTRQAAGKHHIGDFLPPEELERFMEKYNAVKEGRNPDLSDYKEFKLKEDNVGYRLLQKMGWNEGQGLGQDGTGITHPVNKAATRHENQGLGVDRPDGLEAGDDEYDAYRKRMMLAYRFRPNPLNNPRRPYY